MTDRPPAFATDRATARYYELRAAEYDEWYRGEGRFASRERPGWHHELGELCTVLGRLPAARTLDVACGTAYLSVHLRGPVVGVDRSRSMVELARSRVPAVAVADALALPFSAGSFGRIFAGHFYGHLPPTERRRFSLEARRVAEELVVVDSAHREGLPDGSWQERVLNDGSRHRVFKRYLSASQLADEVCGEVLFEGAWFVAALARHATRATRAT